MEGERDYKLEMCSNRVKRFLLCLIFPWNRRGLIWFFHKGITKGLEGFGLKVEKLKVAPHQRLE